MKGMLLAIKHKALADFLSTKKDYNHSGRVMNNDDVEPAIKKYSPDILVITEGLPAERNKDTVSMLIDLKNKYKNLRIIYLAGGIDESDTFGYRRLGTLVKNGIYDIYHSKNLSKKVLDDLLNNPKSKSDVDYLLRYDDYKGDLTLEFNDDAPEVLNDGYANVHIFTSIKPGSGKSFIATNVATAIAKWGQRKNNGNFPRVAIVEGDLQTLSVGTLLQLDDKERNLKNALDKVGTVITEEGDVIGTQEEIARVQEYVYKCFLKSYEVDNLYALVGSQLTLSELDKINPFQYYFMIELMTGLFDVIIVDTNSSLEHRTTGPLLDLAKNCFYILDLDYNNVANNIRYRQELSRLGVMKKVKYILNKDIPNYMADKYAEKLEYTAENLHTSGFELIAKIPMIDSTIVYNRAKRGVPLVMDKTKNTIEARKELFVISDAIYPVNVFADLREEMEIYKKGGTKVMDNTSSLPAREKPKKVGLFARLFGKK